MALTFRFLLCKGEGFGLAGIQDPTHLASPCTVQFILIVLQIMSILPRVGPF